MKRMNILLSRNILRDSLLLFLLLLLLPLLLRLVCGPSYLHIVSWIVSLTVSIAVIIYSNRIFPLYLEYDDEKVIAYYPFGKRAVVSRNQTIYTGYTKRNRMEICYVFSNTPFHTSYIYTTDFDAPNDLRFVLSIDRTTQIVIPQVECPEALPLFPFSMRVAAEKVDWDVLTEMHAPTKATTPSTESLYVLPGFPEHLAALAAGGIGLIALLVYIIVSTEFSLLMAIFVLGGLWCESTFKASKQLRFCAKVHFKETVVTSSLFGKTQCSVDLTQPVHYAVFRGGEYGSEGFPYTVISNDRFNYYSIIDEHRSYLSVYDPHTQIAFPYNAETAAICDFDNWHCVGGFGELNMVRSKDAK